MKSERPDALYISILLFGQFVLMGVMEEEQGRVVEVVVAVTRIDLYRCLRHRTRRSPIVMPMRLAVGDVPLWQVATAIPLALVTIVGLIRLAGRIYTGAILSLGSKVRLRDARRGARG